VTNREKILAGAVVAAGALWFGTQGLTRYREALTRNESLQLEAERALIDVQTAEFRGQKARKQLNQWLGQSLPRNREVAESLYQDWLRTQLTEAGLEIAQLSDKSGNNRNPQFGELAIEIRATGAIEKVADFLYRFYASPHLHRISSATLTAEDGGKKLSLTATANALILPDVKRADKLAEGEPQKLPKSKDEFRASLAARNLFVAHTAKTDGTDGKKDEAAAAAKITGMIYGLGGWRMDVQTKDSGDLKHFQQGDDIEFGQLKGKVIELDGRRAVIETDKGRLEVRLGQNFGEAVPVEAPAA
jgi:hypothetical protein